MDTIITIFLLVSSLILSFYFLLNKKTQALNLPPGPPKLPLIGNLHQVAGKLPHRVFRDLARKYGPIMHIKLGQINSIVVSSPRLAKEVLKTHDIATADRPVMLFADMVLSGDRGIVLSQYGDYWRQMKKIISLQLLSVKKVRSFQRIREQELGRMMEYYRLSSGKPVNIHAKVAQSINSVVCISAFGSNCRQQHRLIEFMEEMERETSGLLDMFPDLEFINKLRRNSRVMKLKKTYDDLLDDIVDEHQGRKRVAGGDQQQVDEEEGLLGSLLRIREEGGLEFPITNNVMKAMFLDVFAGGTDTSTTTIEWAMTELIRHPIIMDKVQTEIRTAFKGKTVITEADLQELSYMQCIIKETLRLHPPFPLLVPHGSREQCRIDGYDIPIKQQVFINAWACATDPEYWEEPDSFKPERFEKTSVDFMGNDYQFIPFGSGRRICPGIYFGLRTTELFLAQMLNKYDWKLPHGLNPSNLDTTESLTGGVLVVKKDHLLLIPTLHSSA